MRFSSEILFYFYAAANTAGLAAFLFKTVKSKKFDALEQFLINDMEQNGVNTKHICAILILSPAIFIYSATALMDKICMSLGKSLTEKLRKTRAIKKIVTIKSRRELLQDTIKEKKPLPLKK